MKNLARFLAAVSCVLLVAGCNGPSTDSTQGGYVGGNKLITVVKPADRKPAPVLSGNDLHGKPISTENFENKTIVVNLWGSWCPPCRAEAPDLNAVAKAMKSKDVEFIGIDQRESPATALAFNRAHDIVYPSISDMSGKLSLGFVKSLPAIGIPSTWILDAKGRVAVRISDKTTKDTLTGLIEDVQKSVP